MCVRACVRVCVCVLLFCIVTTVFFHYISFQALKLVTESVESQFIEKGLKTTTKQNKNKKRKMPTMPMGCNNRERYENVRQVLLS